MFSFQFHQFAPYPIYKKKMRSKFRRQNVVCPSHAPLSTLAQMCEFTASQTRFHDIFGWVVVGILQFLADFLAVNRQWIEFRFVFVAEKFHLHKRWHIVLFVAFLKKINYKKFCREI